MFLFSICVAFVSFPEVKEAIFLNEDINNINIETSGSFGVLKQNSCHKTKVEDTFYTGEIHDWCSNVGFKNESVYIQYSIEGKSIKASKYSVRNGCCYYPCCDPNADASNNLGCCCMLFSYSLSGSNDKRVWTTLHKVEKDRHFRFCETKTFDLPSPAKTFKYLRFSLDENYPNCNKCMQLNQIEFYGETISSDSNFEDDNVDEDTVSIIGRFKTNE